MKMNKKNQRRSFWTWIQSPEVGKYSGRITLGIFAVTILVLTAMVKFGTVTADATSGVEKTGDGINEVRMASIDYVFTYDSSVSAEKQEAIRMYVYSSMDAVKLLYMVNMRQTVIFTENEDEIKVDGTTVYVPTSASSDDLWDALDELE